MNDSDFIQEIARKWVELGGDSEGVAWSWKRLQEAVIDIEYAQQSVQATGGESAEQTRIENELSEWGNPSRPSTRA